MTTMNKQQAARTLGISIRTLCTRMKSGAVRFTKISGAGPFQQSVTFTHEQLGLDEPSADPAAIVHDVPINKLYDEPKAESFAPRQPTRDELDEEFADAYRAGAVTDSMGNRIDGTNAKFPTLGTQSLLGPIEIDHGPPAETQSHMLPGLFGTNDTQGNPIAAPAQPTAGFTRSGGALAPGISQDQYGSMMRDWTRRGGGASEAEQEIASRQATQNIRNSFPRR